MALEFFHIRENDEDMLKQLFALEQEIHGARGAALNITEISSFIRYGRIYVAVEYDEVLGSVFYMRDFENPGKVFLYSVNILPREASRNIGVALLMSTLSDLKECALRMVEVLVSPENTKALKIYREKLGFGIINVADETQLDDEDLLVLRKTL